MSPGVNRTGRRTYTVELLHEHDNGGSESGTAVSWDSEKFDEAVSATADILFSLEQDMNICKDRYVKI